MKPISKVAAIHDLSGYGRCSLSSVMPVLAAMGAQCCTLPAAYLSNHTGYPGFTFVDMTPHMRPALAQWKNLGLRFDAVYSGFLGSAAQIDIVRECIRDFKAPGGLALVDPVMGDRGVAYKTYTPEMCAKMKELAWEADLITPNMTEAALLLGRGYQDAPRDETAAREWLTALSGGGERAVVLTGFTRQAGRIGAAYTDRAGNFGMVELPFIGQEYHGTGDLFSSVLLGSMLRGLSLPAAVELAAGFVGDCAKITWAEGTPTAEGVRFEALLGKLC